MGSPGAHAGLGAGRTHPPSIKRNGRLGVPLGLELTQLFFEAIGS